MKLEIQKVKRLKVLRIILVIFFIGSTLIMINLRNVTEKNTQQIHMEVYPLKEDLYVGDRIELQVLVFDQQYKPLNDANVQIELTPKFPHSNKLSKKLMNIDEGLYETEMKLGQWGQWNGIVKLKNGNQFEKKEFQLFLKK